MTRHVFVFTGVLALLLAGVAGAQYPVLDLMVEKVVQKYAQSTCEQLWVERGKPKSQEVEQVMPEAVTRGRDGYLRVFYDKLGLKLRLYQDWLAGGAQIPTLAR